MAKGKRTQKPKKQQKSQWANGVELKPSSYQPSKEELEADISVPVPFDRMVDALFAGDREFGKGSTDSSCKS